MQQVGWRVAPAPGRAPRRRAAPGAGRGPRPGRSSARWWRCSSPGRCSSSRSRSSTDPGAFGADRRRPAARRAAGEPRAGGSASGPGRCCSAARWPRWSPSTTSRAGAGSTGRSCCRWPCRPTCSCSCCSASTTPRAPLQEGCGRCSAPASSCRRSAPPPGRSSCSPLVLYPYVYVLGRAAFLEQSRDTFEAARTLGLSHGRAVRRVALPMARPGPRGRHRRSR